MRKHRKRGKHRKQGYSILYLADKRPKKVCIIEKVFIAFRQLSEPVQTVLIIGILLVIGWLLAHPEVLLALLKVLLGWKSIQAALSES